MVEFTDNNDTRTYEEQQDESEMALYEQAQLQNRNEEELLRMQEHIKKVIEKQQSQQR